MDAFIAALPEWQQSICRDVRELVHAADPEVQETIKRTTQPYFVLDGISRALAARDHVNVFLYDGGIVPDPEGIDHLAGTGTMTARTVAVRQGEKIIAPALLAMFRLIIANNRAGGWRRLKQPS